MTPYSLNYVFHLWQKTKESKQMGDNGKRVLSVALRRYVFPELDEEAISLKAGQFETYCQTFTVDRLKDALDIFERRTHQAIELKQLSSRTRDNYRSVLKRFICWIKEQVWWNELFPEPVSNVAPFRPKFRAKATKGKLQSYQLELDDWSETALSELKAFQEFRLSGGKNLRQARRKRRRRENGRRGITPQIGKVVSSTLKKEEQAISRFFGWYTKEYSNEKLSLSLLTPKKQIKQSQAEEQW